MTHLCPAQAGVTRQRVQIEYRAQAPQSFVENFWGFMERRPAQRPERVRAPDGTAGYARAERTASFTSERSRRYTPDGMES